MTALAGRQWDETTAGGARQALFDEVDRQLRLDEFEWPCDRRVAHKPHPIPVEVRDLADPEPRFVDGPPCPGVKAHPATMIGRAG